MKSMYKKIVIGTLLLLLVAPAQTDAFFFWGVSPSLRSQCTTVNTFGQRRTDYGCIKKKQQEAAENAMKAKWESKKQKYIDDLTKKTKEFLEKLGLDTEIQIQEINEKLSYKKAIYTLKYVTSDGTIIDAKTCSNGYEYSKLKDVCYSEPNACGDRGTGFAEKSTGSRKEHNYEKSCTAQVPPVPTDYGQACTATNACGQTGAGIVACDGSCVPTAGFEGQCSDNSGSGDLEITPAESNVNCRVQAGQGVALSTRSPIVRAGEEAEIFWCGNSLNTCVITDSLGNNVNTPVGAEGSIETGPLGREATFLIKCETDDGEVSDTLDIKVLPRVQET